MGNWQLEVGKFAIYMMFPVASFYAYHQVEIMGQTQGQCKKGPRYSPDDCAFLYGQYHALLDYY